MNCWEFNRCGREESGLAAARLGVCPAFPNHGKHCARAAGTLCGGESKGRFAKQLEDCTTCDFYKSPHYDKTYTGYKCPNYTEILKCPRLENTCTP